MARRSNEVQAAAKLLRPVDADTMRWRALQDARGTILREGCTFTSAGETHWTVTRSVLGRVNQLDLNANGQTIKTCGRRRLPRRLKP